MLSAAGETYPQGDGVAFVDYICYNRSMNENFKNKIRELRESHFPGQSLRGLSGELESQLGEHFYAYLSKIEAGALPSLDFLKKIKGAYKLTDDEYQNLFQLYIHQKLEAESERSGSGLVLEPAPLLFRKTKKKKS